MNREAAIRITLLMHYEPFLDKIQRILDMITQYFKNIDELNNTIIPDEAKQISENQTEKIERLSEEYRQNLIPHFNQGKRSRPSKPKSTRWILKAMRSTAFINSILNNWRAYWANLTLARMSPPSANS